MLWAAFGFGMTSTLVMKWGWPEMSWWWVFLPVYIATVLMVEHYWKRWKTGRITNPVTGRVVNLKRIQMRHRMY